MFTVGIFTTHIPYLAFIACYVWVLLFGMEQAHEGKIQLTEKSVQIEYHVNHAHALAEKSSAFYMPMDVDFVCQKDYETLSCIRKRKTHESVRFYAQSDIPDALFGRPPPALA